MWKSEIYQTFCTFISNKYWLASLLIQGENNISRKKIAQRKKQQKWEVLNWRQLCLGVFAKGNWGPFTSHTCKIMAKYMFQIYLQIKWTFAVSA